MVVVYMVVVHVIVENYINCFFIFRVKLIMSILKSDKYGIFDKNLKFIFVWLLSPNLGEHVVLVFLLFPIHVFLLFYMIKKL